MIRDYSKYEMSEREKILFYSLMYCCIAVTAYLFYHSLIIAAGSGFLAVKLRPYFERHMAAKRMQELNEHFRDMLYCISASVASGRQMPEAIIEAEESMSLMHSGDKAIMKELAHMRKSIKDNNESDRVLLEDFAIRSHNEDINNFVQVYLTCRKLGGDLEKIISRSSAILTDKMNIEREIKAITAQKKLEGRIISAMPFTMLLALNIVSPSYVEPLYEGITGRLVMTGSLAAVIYGIWLMEKISNIEM